MNSDLYCDILVNKLKPGIRNKRRGKLIKVVLFLHDNARPHTSCKTVSTIIKLGFEVLEHPAYSPGLAPSDYFLFGLLKKELKGKRFDSDEGVQKVVQDFFHRLPKSAYKEGIYKLPERWRRCIESQGSKGHFPGTIKLRSKTFFFLEDGNHEKTMETISTNERHRELTRKISDSKSVRREGDRTRSKTCPTPSHQAIPTKRPSNLSPIRDIYVAKPPQGTSADPIIDRQCREQADYPNDTKLFTFDLTSSRQCSRRQAAINFTEATSFYKPYMERFPRQQKSNQRPSFLSEQSSHNCQRRLHSCDTSHPKAVEFKNVEEKNNSPTEFPNSLTPRGMHPRRLNHKVCAIVMLLINLNPKQGLCNGTVMVIQRMCSHVLEAQILTWTKVGHTV
ncbi:hypothetical protein LAZ67_5002322 [Cordylochernes scorpioides]|uniref:DNA helicase Pif1-like 2B domain-containing protein n=1 Tax=Cordylochernes scorpioides TaxID=51811 RepID=A0ABY6KGB0_9ARAC|nr:hypothetical protein LAZ67_5002322 [Cordylochernes scorpioides]